MANVAKEGDTDKQKNAEEEGKEKNKDLSAENREPGEETTVSFKLLCMECVQLLLCYITSSPCNIIDYFIRG